MSVAGIISAASSAFDDIKNSISGRTNSAIATATNAINSIAGAGSSPPPYVSFSGASTNINVPAISSIGPSDPAAKIQAIKDSIGTSPSEFAASVAERITQEAPIENFTTPTISFPTSPTFKNLVKPTALPIDFPEDIPEVPALTLPTSLAVGGYTIPASPSIANPTWGETIPQIDIDVPTIGLVYVEPVYTSTLKTIIDSNLLDGVENGGTGLNTTVQTDIWERQKNRLDTQKDSDVTEVGSFWSNRGLSIPTAMREAQIDEVWNNYNYDVAQALRDESIETAKISNEMEKYFYSTGLSLEELEINHANNVANRAFEAEKATVQLSIDLYNAKITKFNLQLAKYQAKGLEIENKIKIQALILDKYRAELASVELEDKIDRTAIDNYRAILSSHDASIRLYEAEVNAKIAELSIERGKIDIFKAEIEGYIAEISAQKSEVDLYKARLAGETAKIEVHKTEVDAYTTRVEAVKSANDIIIEKIKSDIAIEDLNLRSHLANVDIYKTKSQLANAERGVEADLYNTNVSLYGTAVDQAQKTAELNVLAQERALAIDAKSVELSLAASLANLNAAAEANKVRVRAGVATGEAAASLAGMISGAVSAIYSAVIEGRGVDTIDE